MLAIATSSGGVARPCQDGTVAMQRIEAQEATFKGAESAVLAVLISGAIWLCAAAVLPSTNVRQEMRAS